MPEVLMKTFCLLCYIQGKQIPDGPWARYVSIFRSSINSLALARYLISNFKISLIFTLGFYGY